MVIPKEASFYQYRMLNADTIRKNSYVKMFFQFVNNKFRTSVLSMRYHNGSLKFHLSYKNRKCSGWLLTIGNNNICSGEQCHL